MAASASAPPPCGVAEEWRRHPRLQRHFTSFRDHPNQANVLRRYWIRAQALDVDGLLRHTVHAAAWVALLPEELAARQVLGQDARELSPVRVLAKLLQNRRRSKISPWLRGALHLVALRLKRLQASAIGKTSAHWNELKRSMPRAVWKEMHLQCPMVPSAVADVLTTKKRCRGEDESWDGMCTLGDVRKRHKLLIAQCRFRCGDEKKSAIDDVIHRGCIAFSSGDADIMLSTLIEAVGFLSEPQTSQLCAPEPETRPIVQERLQSAAQKKLRTLLLCLLGKRGPGGLDLQDCGTQKLLKVPLCRLHDILDGIDFKHVKPQKQWLALAEAVLYDGSMKTVSQPKPKKGEIQGSVPSRGRRSIVDGIFTPDNKVQSLPTVFSRAPGVKLVCTKCDLEITSCWHVACLDGVDRLLRPNNGHIKCGNAKFEPQDKNMQVKNDFLYKLPCMHKKVLHKCELCLKKLCGKEVRK